MPSFIDAVRNDLMKRSYTRYIKLEGMIERLVEHSTAEARSRGGQEARANKSNI